MNHSSKSKINISPEQQAISEQLKQVISKRIIKNGAMPFTDFMQAALYEPGLGYYKNSLPVFGAAGDFTTAPEISELYGQCLARQSLQYLEKLPQDACILELGAGSGALAQSMLTYLEQQQAMPEKYYILEVSAELQAIQKQRLFNTNPKWAEKIIWLDRLPETAINAVVIANEVMDAFPVSIFKTLPAQQLAEAYVTLQESNLQCVWQIASKQLLQAYQQLQIPLAEGYQSEINLWLQPWLQSISHSLKQGACILVDYGFDRSTYYHPQRHAGTLMCHIQHHAHSNPMQHIGIQDITAHIDFTAVAIAAEQADFTLEGYTNQASFLLNCGLLDLEKNTSEQQSLQNKQAIKKLTLPHEMGELFKVMLISKNLSCSSTIDPIGFQQQDQCHRL